MLKRRKSLRGRDQRAPPRHGSPPQRGSVLRWTRSPLKVKRRTRNRMRRSPCEVGDEFSTPLSFRKDAHPNPGAPANGNMEQERGTRDGFTSHWCYSVVKIALAVALKRLDESLNRLPEPPKHRLASTSRLRASYSGFRRRANRGGPKAH